MEEIHYDDWENGWISHEDPTCLVYCPNCGERVPSKGLISDFEITWCECGRGFKSKFDVIMYIKEDK